jgi:hypothetical protein
LVPPGHRKINETLETVTTWQASLDCSPDNVRGEECKRQGHPNRTSSVECAVAIQKLMAERNAGAPEAKRTHYRTGVNAISSQRQPLLLINLKTA